MRTERPVRSSVLVTLAAVLLGSAAAINMALELHHHDVPMLTTAAAAGCNFSTVYFVIRTVFDRRGC